MPETHNMMDYAATRHGFSLDVPERFNFARDVLDEWAKTPDLTALWWLGEAEEKRFSYQDLARASRRCANLLSEQGIQKGDTVIVMLGRNYQWWEVFSACLRMGAIVAPATSQLSEKDLEYRINASGARCVVTDVENAAKVDAIAMHCDNLSRKILVGGTRRDWVDYAAEMNQASESFDTLDTAAGDEAILYFTSGTTGSPKMTVHTQASYGIGHFTTGTYWLDLRPGDVHWNISDTGWAKAAWSSYFGPFICGACVFVDAAREFNPVRTLELIDRYPISTLCGAPTVYRMLVQQNLQAVDFSDLRHCVAAGEPLNPEVIESWHKATQLTIRDGYGQTETVLLCGNFPCL